MPAAVVEDAAVEDAAVEDAAVDDADAGPRPRYCTTGAGGEHVDSSTAMPPLIPRRCTSWAGGVRVDSSTAKPPLNPRCCPTWAGGEQEDSSTAIPREVVTVEEIVAVEVELAGEVVSVKVELAGAEAAAEACVETPAHDMARSARGRVQEMAAATSLSTGAKNRRRQGAPPSRRRVGRASLSEMAALEPGCCALVLF